MKQLLSLAILGLAVLVLTGCNDETVPSQKQVDGLNKLRGATAPKTGGGTAPAPAPAANAPTGAQRGDVQANPGATYGGK
ncbi:MAG: hypothetical protein ABUL72_03445 [Armatimonadota bacterium]